MKKSKLFFLAASVLGIIALGLIMYFYDPSSSNVIIFAGLYSSFFLAALGLSGFILYSLNNKFRQDQNSFGDSRIVRQSAIIALLALVLLLLQSFRVLSFASAGITVAAAIILEMYFSTN